MTIELLARRVRAWIDARLGASAPVVAIRQRQAPHPEDFRRLGMKPQDFLSFGHG